MNPILPPLVAELVNLYIPCKDFLILDKSLTDKPFMSRNSNFNSIDNSVDTVDHIGYIS